MFAVLHLKEPSSLFHSSHSCDSFSSTFRSFLNLTWTPQICTLQKLNMNRFYFYRLERVPREVQITQTLVKVIQSMWERNRAKFGVHVGAHQPSYFSPSLFILSLMLWVKREVNICDSRTFGLHSLNRQLSIKWKCHFNSTLFISLCRTEWHLTQTTVNFTF